MKGEQEGKLLNKDHVKYDEAVTFVTKNGFCSISILQREFYLNYNTAARVQERMLREGLLAKHHNHIYRLNTQQPPHHNDNKEG